MWELNANIERLEPSEKALLAARGWSRPTKRAALAELARMGRTRLS